MSKFSDLASSMSNGSPSISQQAVAVNAAIFLAVLAYVLHRQFSTRAVTSRTFMLISILFAYGLYSGLPTAPLGITLLGTSVVVSIGFGLWRGASMRMWLAPDGVVYRRGTTLTITLWVITVTIKIAIDVWETTRTHTFSTGSIWLAMAVTLAVQQLVLLRRATTLTSPTARTPVPEPHP